MEVEFFGNIEGKSGVEIYAKELYQNLQKYDIDISYILPSKILKPYFLNQIFMNWLKYYNSEAEVFHATNQDLMSVVFLPDVENLVVTVHDIYPYLEGFSGPIYSWMAEKYIKNIENQADKVIAISEGTEKQLLNNTKVNSEKIEVIYQGVDSEVFRPVESDIGYGRYFLHVGHELDRKNIGGLIKIFERIKKKDSKVRLVRVGEMSEQTEKLIKESSLKLGEDIFYEKDAPIQRLVELYSGAEKLLFPSKGEGFGRPIIESLACGTPVVAYNREPMNEILSDTMLVEWEDTESFARKALDEQSYDCRKAAQKFTWEKTAKQTKEVYEECLK